MLLITRTKNCLEMLGIVTAVTLIPGVLSIQLFVRNAKGIQYLYETAMEGISDRESHSINFSM